MYRLQYSNFLIKKSKVKIQKMFDYDESSTFELNDETKPYNIGHRCFYFSKELILFIRNYQYEKIYFSQLINC
jgi:hypothetical protein